LSADTLYRCAAVVQSRKSIFHRRQASPLRTLERRRGGGIIRLDVRQHVPAERLLQLRIIGMETDHEGCACCGRDRDAARAAVDRAGLLILVEMARTHHHHLGVLGGLLQLGDHPTHVQRAVSAGEKEIEDGALRAPKRHVQSLSGLSA